MAPAAGFAPRAEALRAGLRDLSLARPGGNATGMTMLLTDLVAKELEVFKEAIPQARRFGVLLASTALSHVPALEAAETAARQLAVALRYAPVRSESDLRVAIQSMAQDVSTGSWSLPRR